MRPDLIAELLRMSQADIAFFEARMQEVTHTYQPGDCVDLSGEVVKVYSYQSKEMPGYWLRAKKEDLFLPLGWENAFRPVWPKHLKARDQHAS